MRRGENASATSLGKEARIRPTGSQFRVLSQIVNSWRSEMDSNQRYLSPYCLARSQRRPYHRKSTSRLEDRPRRVERPELTYCCRCRTRPWTPQLGGECAYRGRLGKYRSPRHSRHSIGNAKYASPPEARISSKPSKPSRRAEFELRRIAWERRTRPVVSEPLLSWAEIAGLREGLRGPRRHAASSPSPQSSSAAHPY